MLKKSLMLSELTGLLALFFSAALSLVQVRCTFSGAASASGSSPGDWELPEKVVVFLSWISCTCGVGRKSLHPSHLPLPLECSQTSQVAFLGKRSHAAAEGQEGREPGCPPARSGRRGGQMNTAPSGSRRP